MDRFMRGAIAGLIAGIVKDIWTLIPKYLGFTKISFIDWMGVIEFGYLPYDSLHFVLATITHLIVLSGLGVGFAYLVPQFESGYIVVKGIMYSLFTGAILYAIPVFFKMPYIGKVSAYTEVSNIIGSIIYGVVLAVVIQRLSNRVR